jgi:hypothetical protein
VGDQRIYRSAAFFAAGEDPARLDAATFRVGQTIAPLTSKSGSNVLLAWPAVSGASAYRIRVWNLATRLEIPCPSGLDCLPTTPGTTHVGGASSATSYGYRVTALDACGAESPD